MKLTHTLYLLGLSCLLFTGCFSLHSGAYVSSVSLTQPNYQYVKTVNGKAEAIYFLGFGGLNKNKLISDAKENMYSNAGLTTNQDIANVVVSEKMTSLFLIGFVKEITLTGDVIEWTTSQPLNPRGQLQASTNTTIEENILKNKAIKSYKNCDGKIFTKYNSIEDVKIGDVVLLSGATEYGIVTMKNDLVLTIEVFDESGKVKSYNQNYDMVKVVNCN